jgi:polyisoprenyl-teichoic acid--peptidoglycan teichoic acid transferase
VSAPLSSSWRAWLWRYLLALVLVSTATAGGLVGSSWYLDHALKGARSVSVDLDRRLPGSVNFLILGSDSRAFVSDKTDRASFGSTREVGGQRADAIIVARVEPKSRRGVLVSFPRDLRVRQPGRNGLRRINESFENGPQGVIDTIKANFDIPINHYLEVDFSGFRSMVDALGGVRMYVPSPVRDKMTGLDIRVPGCVTLNGGQALAWVRSRHYTYFEAGRWRTDPTGDIGRIDRQQEFIRRLMAQAIERGALNPVRANRLADATMANLKVDSGFNVRDALRLVQAFQPVGPAAVEMVALPTREVSSGLAMTADSQAVLDRLRGRGPAGAMGEAAAARPSGPPVAPNDVRVRVLNGTGVAGVAGDTSARLAEAGFAPAGSGDAERFSYGRTEIHYQSRAKAELVARYLKGPARLVADSHLRDVDVVVIAGADFKGVAPRPSGAPPGGVAAPPPTSTSTATTAPPAPASAGQPTPSGAPARPTC